MAFTKSGLKRSNVILHDKQQRVKSSKVIHVYDGPIQLVQSTYLCFVKNFSTLVSDTVVSDTSAVMYLPLCTVEVYFSTYISEMNDIS